MATQQPDWRFVVNLGDANPVEHDGCFVFEDATGAYPPEMEVWQGSEDNVFQAEGQRPHWTVYRFALERCTYIDGVLSDNEFHPDSRAWWAKSAEQNAHYHGIPANKWAAGFCSEDTLTRALAYRDVIDYYGAHEFDHYPQKFDEDEIRGRAAEYRRLERDARHARDCARVGLHPDTPAPIVRDAMIDAGLIQE